MLALITYLHPSELLNAPCSSILPRIKSKIINYYQQQLATSISKRPLHDVDPQRQLAVSQQQHALLFAFAGLAASTLVLDAKPQCPTPGTCSPLPSHISFHPLTPPRDTPTPFLHPFLHPPPNPTLHPPSPPFTHPDPPRHAELRPATATRRPCGGVLMWILMWM